MAERMAHDCKSKSNDDLSIGLRSALARIGATHGAVGVRTPGGPPSVVAVRLNSATESSDFSIHTPVHLGCLTKTFTATLAARAVGRGRLAFDADVSDLLGVEPRCGIKVRHLLNHTHGFDGSAVARLPRLASGRIDVTALWKQLTDARRISPPGEMYNYNSAGSWLAAAVLERIDGRLYRELLCELLEEHVSAVRLAEIRAIEPHRVCPALGDELSLSVGELLSFAQAHLEDDSTSGLAMLREDPFRPVEWEPKLRGIALGWYELGEGWFGHSSRLYEESAMIRICPQRRMAIAVAARGEDSAQAILGALFGDDLPEFAGLQAARFVAERRWSSLDAAPYSGRYGNSRLTIIVDLGANGALRIRAFPHDEDGAQSEEPYVKRYLRPAEWGVFYSAPPDPQIIPCAQFLSPDATGRFRYLHTGKQLLPRLDAAVSVSP